MNDEVEETVKELGMKPPKRRIGKKGKIAIIATVLVIAILIGAYVAMILMTPPEKYWKPEKEFKRPDVEWSRVTWNYIINRTKDGKEHILNTNLGNKQQTKGVSLEFSIHMIRYMAHEDGTGYLDLEIYIYSTNEEYTYKIKSLEFKFDYGNDSNVSYLSLTWDKIAAKNLCFDVTPGRYSGPWGTFDNRLDYEWMDNFRITGENKNGEDIKEAGFSFPMSLLFFDTYPHWYNHTITFTAILEYGKYVHGWFGNHWEDVLNLCTSIVIYVVSEGGV